MLSSHLPAVGTPVGARERHNRRPGRGARPGCVRRLALAGGCHQLHQASRGITGCHQLHQASRGITGCHQLHQASRGITGWQNGHTPTWLAYQPGADVGYADGCLGVLEVKV